jgi:presequence protease
MKVGEIYSGFLLKRTEKIKEINSVANVFEHVKTGAKLLHLGNDDNNKVFSIAFKTPPYDNTGLPHILEHSVLAGSRKFPIKNPLFEMASTSLSTFINAMTYPDKTIYPIASQNEKDFFNLMEMHLDSVFYPKIYEKPEIFMQEAWHYELSNISKNIGMNGIVYSEMKGSFSSPDSVMRRKITTSLYPNTIYNFESGGEPDEIPNLKYEDFIEYHKKYYHPSNSYIYLYGNGNLRKQLKFLNEQYLKDFKKKLFKEKIKFQQKSKKISKMALEYPISKEENSKNKHHFSLNFALCKNTDIELAFAFSILVKYLIGTESSPLRIALLSEKIGDRVFGQYFNETFETYVSFCLKNANNNSGVEFRKIIFKVLENIVKNGVDEDLIEACINRREFKMREADYANFPKGLVYNDFALTTWLYEGDPLSYLQYEKMYKKLRKLVKEGYFEKLIKKYFLDSKHSSFISLSPKKGLGELRDLERQKN